MAPAVRGATRAVEHQTIVRRDHEANTTACRPEPAQAVFAIDRQEVARQRASNGKERRADVAELLAEGRPIKVGFDAEHKGARLPVVAGLAAADESGALRSETAREPSSDEAAINAGVRV